MDALTKPRHPSSLTSSQIRLVNRTTRNGETSYRPRLCRIPSIRTTGPRGGLAGYPAAISGRWGEEEQQRTRTLNLSTLN